LKTIINEGRKLPDGLVKNMITIVPPGGTFTPKQLQLEKGSGKL
jgi:hypothetical protein